MTQIASSHETGAVVLGAVGRVATWRRSAQARWSPVLTVQVCSETDENGYSPAESITIVGREGLLALRFAIDEALKEVTSV